MQAPCNTDIHNRSQIKPTIQKVVNSCTKAVLNTKKVILRVNNPQQAQSYYSRRRQRHFLSLPNQNSAKVREKFEQF